MREQARHAPAPVPSELAGAADWLEGALGRDGANVYVLPAPVMPVVAWLAAARDLLSGRAMAPGAAAGAAAGAAVDAAAGLDAVLFAPPEPASAGSAGAIALAGVGIGWQISITGADARSELRAPAVLRARADALFDRLRLRAAPGTTAPPPRLIGGLAFAPGAAADCPWQSFGDGRFVLPRWTYGHDGKDGFLQLACPVPTADAARAALRELALLSSIFAPGAGPAPSSRTPRPALLQDEEDLSGWTAQVRAILAALAAGTCEKIVAARRVVLTTDAARDPDAVLAALDRAHPSCTRFALTCGGTTFLGATPERLVLRRGKTVHSDALAGSAAQQAQADTLLGSAKDLTEHGLVVREILRALAPHCAHLEAAAAPALRRLRHVQHLHTPIHGELRADRPAHVLDLVAALHPTPAVGGAPRDVALRWIRDHEPAPRGWYAAPVGWFDAAGDGEFVVALRSGVLEGRRAYLYAGAGIVPGSDPTREHHETALKLRTLRGALGVPELVEAP